MAEPPFLMRLAAHVAEVPESEDISGGQGHQVCFRSSGVSGRKMCCGAPETSQSGASAGKLHADTLKGSEMNVKMTEVGHMGRKHSLMPRRMI